MPRQKSQPAMMDKARCFMKRKIKLKKEIQKNQKETTIQLRHKE
jgi:hypothetical protein